MKIINEIKQWIWLRNMVKGFPKGYGWALGKFTFYKTKKAFKEALDPQVENKNTKNGGAFSGVKIIFKKLKG